MTHPPAFKLDAVAAGDADAGVEGHLTTCEACRTYVAALREGAGRFRSRADPMGFVQACEALTERVRPVQNLRGRVMWLAAPSLAIAAALALWLHGRPYGHAPDFRETTSEADPSRFKGPASIVVVREREGRQTRIVGPVEVASGDRIRVQLDVDRAGPFTAGLLSDDGAWAPLLAPTALEAGTHYSELAARFDETPTHATLLVGAPDAVDTARRTRNFEGVVAIRVTTEPSQ